MKSKILAKNEKKIKDLVKKFKIIQDYPRSWQENQDAMHWAAKNQRILKPKCQMLPDGITTFEMETISCYKMFTTKQNVFMKQI